jgi:hypothetical protein
VLQAAIDRVTAVLATAADDAVAELVSERRALRDELREMRQGEAGVVLLNDAAGAHGACGGYLSAPPQDRSGIRHAQVLNGPARSTR